jgi:hypothetical protein
LTMTPVLHPRYQTAYFTKAGWLPEWIRAAEGLARAEWQAYKPVNQAPATSMTPVSNHLPNGLLSYCHARTYLVPLRVFSSL